MTEHNATLRRVLAHMEWKLDTNRTVAPKLVGDPRCLTRRVPESSSGGVVVQRFTRLGSFMSVVPMSALNPWPAVSVRAPAWDTPLTVRVAMPLAALAVRSAVFLPALTVSRDR